MSKADKAKKKAMKKLLEVVGKTGLSRSANSVTGGKISLAVERQRKK